MMTRRFYRTTRFPRFYSQFALSTRPSVVLSPLISRPLRLAKPAYILLHFGNTLTTFTTKSIPSKSDPTMGSGQKGADRLEALLQKGQFQKMGLRDISMHVSK